MIDLLGNYGSTAQSFCGAALNKTCLITGWKNKHGGIKMTLIEMHSIIRKRPGMWIGKYDLHRLHCFVLGFLFDDKDNDKLTKAYKDYFHSYVNDWLYNNTESSELKEELRHNNGRGFPNLIPLVRENEKEQLELYFEIFDSFCLAFKNNTDFEKIKSKYCS